MGGPEWAALEVKSNPVLTVERVEVRPVWADLLQGRMAPATFIVRNATLPQAGIDGVLDVLQKKNQDKPDDKASGSDAGKMSVAQLFLDVPSLTV